MARSNEKLTEWEKIVKQDFETTKRLNTKYCQLCGREIINHAGRTPDQREFEETNKIHYDCAVAYERKREEKAKEEIAKRMKTQQAALREEEARERIKAQKKELGSE